MNRKKVQNKELIHSNNMKNLFNNLKHVQNLVLEFSSSPLQDCGGIMSLADVWCRVNRARGLELISPEDLLNACKYVHM